MKQIKIDKNVPIPLARNKAKYKYPWDKMEVNDSFYIDTPAAGLHAMIRVRNTRHPEMTFIVRKDGNGARVWRIK